jgi:aminoglycoside 6'-N-acetyltransferase
VIDPLNSNLAAHRFYRRLGFEVVGRRIFDKDDCLVHRLTRESWQDRSRA